MTISLYRGLERTLEVISYPIWTNEVIHHDLWSIGKDTSTSKDLSWTTLTSARLIINAQVQLFPCAVSARVNGSEVGRADFPAPGAWDTSLDVTNLLAQGRNNITFSTWKFFMTGFGDVIINASLQLEGEGITVEDPPWEWLQWFKDNPLAVVGIAMGVAGGVIYYTKRRKKKK